MRNFASNLLIFPIIRPLLKYIYIYTYENIKNMKINTNETKYKYAQIKV